MNKKDIAEFLEEKYIQYNNSNFIEDDPVKIPHEYTKIEDIEILRFFYLNIKIKMIRLNSNSVAVDVLEDVKKAEKLLRNKN